MLPPRGVPASMIHRSTQTDITLRQLDELASRTSSDIEAKETRIDSLQRVNITSILPYISNTLGIVLLHIHASFLYYNVVGIVPCEIQEYIIILIILTCHMVVAG